MRNCFQSSTTCLPGIDRLSHSVFRRNASSPTDWAFDLHRNSTASSTVLSPAKSSTTYDTGERGARRRLVRPTTDRCSDGWGTFRLLLTKLKDNASSFHLWSKFKTHPVNVDVQESRVRVSSVCPDILCSSVSAPTLLLVFGSVPVA